MTSEIKVYHEKGYLNPLNGISDLIPSKRLAGAGVALAAIGLCSASIVAGAAGAALLGKVVWDCYKQSKDLVAFLREMSVSSSLLKFSSDERERIRVAEVCAQQDGERTAGLIQKFGIKDEQALIRIAKLCATQLPLRTIELIKNFNIQTEQGRIEVAKHCAQQNGWKTAQFIDNFQIQNEKARIEIAKLCAQQNAWQTAELIGNFQIQNEKARIEIAKLCAQRFCWGLPQLIGNFQIRDEMARVEIAKLCAQQDGEHTAELINKFQIQDEKARVEIVKLCAQQNIRKTVELIGNFQIQDEMARVEIAKFCVQQNSLETTRFLHNFQIQDEQSRIEIAKLCAQEDGVITAQLFYKFNIRDEKIANEILTIAAIENPYSTFHFHNEIDFQYRKSFLFYSVNNQRICQRLLQSFINTDLSKAGFEWVIPYLDSVNDLYIKRELTISLAAALFILKQRLSTEMLSFANKQGLIKAVYALRSPQLYIPFIDEVIQFCSNPEALENFEKQAICELAPSYSPLLKVCLSEMNSLNEASISFFNRPKNIKLFKDGPKARLLLYTLRRLRSEPSLSIDEKRAVLEKIYTSADLYTVLCLLQIIFDLGESSRLKYLTQDFKFIAQNAISQKIPVIRDLENAAVQIADTFGRSRNPQAIWQYAAKMHQTNDPNVLNCLGAFISSVAKGSFLTFRYDLNQNPHLQKLGKDVVGLWKEGISIDFVNENKGSFNPFDWLHTKLIVDQHLSLSEVPLLCQYLQSNRDDPQRQKLYDASKESPFERACMDLARAQTLEEQLHFLSLALSKLPQLNSDFKNDLEGQISLLRSPLRKGSLAIDTDDPYHLLLCGTEVAGSCQRIDGKQHTNKGLLGYLMNGQTRLLAVVDEKGSIVARSLLRLLWDGNKPVLFLERHYGSSEYRETIEKLAKEKAKKMGLTLTSLTGKGAAYKSLQSLGGLAPFEYCDGSTGVQAKSLFKIENSRLLE
jgi:hypothetical protein